MMPQNFVSFRIACVGSRHVLKPVDCAISNVISEPFMNLMQPIWRYVNLARWRHAIIARYIQPEG